MSENKLIKFKEVIMLINKWLQKALNAIDPIRIVATIEAQCNLKCLHCHWSHDMNHKSVDDWSSAVNTIKQFDVPLLYAGRILTKAGTAFLSECLNQNLTFSIIDNGYTILTRPQFLHVYGNIDISIDGWRDAHDTQRGKNGSFDRAWNTILELKNQGFDPTVASAFSPISFRDWDRFEDMLSEHDVPLSSTLVWALPETAKRGTAIFKNDSDVIKAFERLMGGIPKLISLYATEHLEILRPVLTGLRWRKDAVNGDCLVTTLGNGTSIIYRPPSVVAVGEVVLHWDGEFYTSPTYGNKHHLARVDRKFFEEVRRLNEVELKTWRGGD